MAELSPIDKAVIARDREWHAIIDRFAEKLGRMLPHHPDPQCQRNHGSRVPAQVQNNLETLADWQTRWKEGLEVIKKGPPPTLSNDEVASWASHVAALALEGYPTQLTVEESHAE
jgi:hypothetical protein